MQNQKLAINNQYIHYLEQGTGNNNIVFLHGIPTSSFLWRNIIPTFINQAKCIAPDLIGMGESSKPDINYSITDHIEYFSKFMQKLNLTNTTLVMHGWGSIIGTEYARLNPNKINGLVFFESHLKPILKESLSLPIQHFIHEITQTKDLKQAVLNDNLIVNMFLQKAVLGKLPTAIRAKYEQPFATINSRKLLLTYITEILNIDKKNTVNNLIKNYTDYLSNTPIPKCLIYATPGLFTNIDTVSWAKNTLPNLDLINLESALHFAQETIPFEFADKLHSWYIDNIK